MERNRCSPDLRVRQQWLLIYVSIEIAISIRFENSNHSSIIIIIFCFKPIAGGVSGDVFKLENKNRDFLFPLCTVATLSVLVDVIDILFQE